MEKTFKIKVAKYKNSKTLFARFIRFQQKRLQKLPQKDARFTHTETVLCYVDDPDVKIKLNEIENIYSGKENRKLHPLTYDTHFEIFDLWFSSSETDGGTRFKFIDDSSGNWIYQEIEITKDQYLELLQFYIDIADNDYDMTSIVFTQGLRTFWFNRPDAYFCSEVVMLGLKIIGFFPLIDAIRVNPGGMSNLLRRNKHLLLKNKSGMQQITHKR